MRVTLGTDPAVIGIATALNIHDDSVIGKLFKLWAWANQHSNDGLNVPISLKWLDEYLDAPGFCSALSEAGWLVLDDNSISFPNFDRHNSSSAKKRAENTLRQQVSRQSVTQKCDKSVTREEKRREEKITTTDGLGEVPYSIIQARWNEATKAIPRLSAVSRMTDARRRHLQARWGEGQFRDGWQVLFEMVARNTFLAGSKGTFKADFDWLIKNDSNYVKVLEHKYDQHEERAKETLSQMLARKDREDADRG